MADNYGNLDEEDEDTPESLKAQLAAAPAAAAGPGDAKLGKPSEYLSQLKTLSENPDYARTVPPDTRQSLKDAVSKAEEAYKGQVSNNQWGEIAQQLSRAAAQFGAAHLGMRTGRPMGGLDFGPGIDYGSRNDQAFREYQQSIKNAENSSGMEREKYLDEAAAKKEELNKRAGYLGSALKASEERESLNTRLASAQAREAARNRHERDILTEQDKRMNLGELEKQEKTLASQLQARQTLFNDMNQEEDLSNKSAKKLQEKYGQLAAQGGVDLNALKDEMEKNATKPGLISRATGGIIATTNPDEDKQSKLMQDKINEVRDMLASVQSDKKKLLSNSGGNLDQQASTPPSPSRDSKVQEYADQYFSGDYEKAKKVLTGRGYKPNEQSAH